MLVHQRVNFPGALPSLWALSLAFLGGAAAVTNPNLKGLLMSLGFYERFFIFRHVFLDLTSMILADVIHNVATTK